MKLILVVFILLLSCHNKLVGAADSNTKESAGADVAQKSSGQLTNEEQANEQPTSKKSTIKQAVLGMNVSGNKELPNVLYIIPWKNNPKSNIDNKPSQNIMLDEIFAPIDPQAFSKKVKFYHQITSPEVKDK